MSNTHKNNPREFWIKRKLIWAGLRQKFQVFSKPENTDETDSSAFLESYSTPFDVIYSQHIYLGTNEFCRISTRWHLNWQKYTLKFTNGSKIYIISCNHLPFSDTIFKGKRIRIMGTSTINKPKMKPSLDFIQLADNEPCILDKMKEHHTPNTPILTWYNWFYGPIRRSLLLLHYEKDIVDKILAAETLQNGMQPLLKLGAFNNSNLSWSDLFSLKCKDSVFALNQDVWTEEDVLEICCIVLVLRQQEYIRWTNYQSRQATNRIQQTNVR